MSEPTRLSVTECEAIAERNLRQAVTMAGMLGAEGVDDQAAAAIASVHASIARTATNLAEYKKRNQPTRPVAIVNPGNRGHR